MRKHTFSFSFQGLDDRCTSGIERNETFLKESGLDYEVVLHSDRPWILPNKWTNVIHPTGSSLECDFWRFETVGTLPLVHVRDIDSTISSRELPELDRAAIYCIRDRHYQLSGGEMPWPCPVQGGMWGATKEATPHNFSRLVKWWVAHKAPFERYSDMWFLNRYIYPYIRKFGLEIDGTGYTWGRGGVPFLAPRVGISYVGEVAGATHKTTNETCITN